MPDQPEMEFQTGDDLPQGSATQIEELEGAVAPATGAFGGLFDEDFDEDDDDDDIEPADETEAFLFAQSERPDEPVTQGAPFGPGADFSRGAGESGEMFLRRTALHLQNSDSPVVKQFAQGVLAGE